MPPPLLQWWFANSQPKSDNPYSLYIASNVGTLAGLLSCPLLIEPALGLQIQSKGWLACWILLTLTLSACIWVTITRQAAIIPNANKLRMLIHWLEQCRCPEKATSFSKKLVRPLGA